MRFALVLIAIGLTVADSLAQEPGWSYPRLTTAQPPSPPQPPPAINHAVPPPDSAPLVFVEGGFRDTACGQQHWVALNVGIFQPTTVRAAFKVWPRPQNSLWVEAYAGSVLVHTMYGFGVRMQHTARTFRNGDQLMISPGLGVHILPNWDAYSRRPSYWGWDYAPDSRSNTLYYLAGDVDISWLHDFGPHFGFEMGVKVGLAGRVSGDIGKYYPRSLMFGKDVYPIFAVYSGFRF